MKRSNEKNASEAFGFILRTLTGSPYIQIESPDATNSRTPDVDYIFGVPQTRIRRVAAEHTIVETFEGQIRYVNIAFDLVREINLLCRGKLPNDRYLVMSIPDALINSLGRKQRKVLVQDMTTVLPTKCERLQVDNYTTIQYESHQIWLKCEGAGPELNGNVIHIQLTPPAVDQLKRRRLARALAEKLPQLIRYKFMFHSTALLLEDISGAIGSIGPGSDSMSFWQKLIIRFFVDYIVVFASNEGRMIVGNVWKEGLTWHAIVPYPRRFHLKAVGVGQRRGDVDDTGAI